MTPISLFDQTQLAEATYADFVNATTGSTLSDPQQVAARLVASGFSASQAAAFVSRWRVAHQQPNVSFGYSATLFEDLLNPGQHVWALRGTEQPWDDLVVTDAFDIVQDGLALDQVVAMYNDWQRIVTPESTTYAATKLVTLISETTALAVARLGQFVPGFNMTSDAFLAWLYSRTDVVIDNGPLGERVRQIVFESSALVFADERRYGVNALKGGEVVAATGHSLGGHLAAAFTRLFPGLDIPALTVNAAGFATGFVPGLGGDAALNIRNLFGALGGASVFDFDRIANIYGERGPELVTQNGPLLFQQGGHHSLFIEALLGNKLGHGSSQMTDSLAVYDLFIRLDKPKVPESNCFCAVI